MFGIPLNVSMLAAWMAPLIEKDGKPDHSHNDAFLET